MSASWLPSIVRDRSVRVVVVVVVVVVAVDDDYNDDCNDDDDGDCNNAAPSRVSRDAWPGLARCTKQLSRRETAPRTATAMISSAGNCCCCCCCCC